MVEGSSVIDYNGNLGYVYNICEQFHDPVHQTPAMNA